jgi:hypothetical protein
VKGEPEPVDRKERIKNLNKTLTRCKDNKLNLDVLKDFAELADIGGNKNRNIAQRC